MTPLKHIDRTWLRRTILVGAMIPAIFLYLGTGLYHWGRDFYETWRYQ